MPEGALQSRGSCRCRRRGAGGGVHRYKKKTNPRNDRILHSAPPRQSIQQSQNAVQALFGRGATSPELVTLLSTRPGEHGLKQAARTIDASLSAAHATAVQLHAALQRSALLLEDLGGAIAGSAALADCGIQVRRRRSPSTALR